MTDLSLHDFILFHWLTSFTKQKPLKGKILKQDPENPYPLLEMTVLIFKLV